MNHSFHKDIAPEPDESPPSETWLFAQALLGNPIPDPRAAAERARAEREQLEWLAQISTEHEQQLQCQLQAEAAARAQREQLEWLATISTEHEQQLRTLLSKEAEEREAWRRAHRFAEQLFEGDWDPSQHPRGAYAQNRGWWSPGGGAGSAAAAPVRAGVFQTADSHTGQATAQLAAVGATQSPAWPGKVRQARGCPRSAAVQPLARGRRQALAPADFWAACATPAWAPTGRAFPAPRRYPAFGPTSLRSGFAREHSRAKTPSASLAPPCSAPRRKASSPAAARCRRFTSPPQIFSIMRRRYILRGKRKQRMLTRIQTLNWLRTPLPSPTTRQPTSAVFRAQANPNTIATNKNWLSTLRGGPWSPRLEKLFNKAGMTLKDAANKVRVPGHQGPHPEEYHREIFRRLSEATEGKRGAAYKEALLNQLEEIAKEARTPGSTLNRLLTK